MTYSVKLVFLLISPCLLSQAQTLGQWEQIQYTPPSAILSRFGHAGAYLSSTNEFLVYGGTDSTFYFVDNLYSINMANLQSTQLLSSGQSGGRTNMAFTSDTSSNLYVHGGRQTAPGIVPIFLYVLQYVICV
jgi:hypothetical protein